MWLTVHESGGPKRRVEVGAGAFSVGRGRDCDLVLADVKASRRHALIEGRTDGTFTLRDLASTNGTAINGRKIAASVDLHEGEQITIGTTTLTVAEVDAQPAPTAAERPIPAGTNVLRAAPLDIEPPQPLDRSARRWSRRTIAVTSAGAVFGLLVLVLVAAQLVLPAIAGSQLRDSLKAHGTVQSASVDAFPAVTLLWHHADRVRVRMVSYTDATTAGVGASLPGSGTQRLADFLARTSATDALDARVDRLKVGRLSLESAVLTKRGDELTGSAHATYADLRAALPSYLQIRAFAAGGGELVFIGAATLLGRSATVRMRLSATNGALVVRPVFGPFQPSLLSLTVFKDPRVSIESVSAAPAADGFNLVARARLRQG